MTTAPVFGAFEWGLSLEEEDRARRLHDESVVVDMLTQGPVSHHAFPDEHLRWIADERTRCPDPLELLVRTWRQVSRWGLDGSIDLRALWDQSGVTAGTFETTLAEPVDILASVAFADEAFETFDWMVKALRVEDILRAKAHGGHAAFLNCQHPPRDERPLRFYDSLHRLGLRMLQLAYNSASAIGSGCTEPVDHGLTAHGRAVVRRLNALGVLIDTSHCGEVTTLEAARASDAPILASHTSASTLFPAARAKSDRELLAIAETGGVVGVYAVADYFGSEPGVSIARMLEHVRYISDLIGPEHVGLAADWPMAAPKWLLADVTTAINERMAFNEPDAAWDRNLVGFDDYRDYPNITRGLVRAGFTDDEIRGVLGGNFLRVFGAVCG